MNANTLVTQQQTKNIKYSRGVSVGKWYSVPEAAEALGVSGSTIRRWILEDEGKPPEEKFFPGASKKNPWIPGSPHQIPEEDIKRFLNRRKG